MEYGLRRELKTASVTKTGLNPCCNGIWSQTDKYSLYRQENGLNPCCNGIWSQTTEVKPCHASWWVLILVVMEYGLRHCTESIWLSYWS